MLFIAQSRRNCRMIFSRSKLTAVLFRLQGLGTNFTQTSVLCTPMDGGLTKCCSPAISSRFISSSSHSSLNCFTRNLSSRTCWNCQKVVPQGEYFCSCGKIQPVPPEANYFNLLGYPSYVARVDAAELSNRMRAAQRQLHPDKFSRVSFHEKSLAADASTAINKAYSTLASPADRFEYILSVYSPLEAEHNLQDPEFLMEILELSEELEHLLNELNKTPSSVEIPSDKKDHVVRLFHKFSRLAKQEENNISSLLTDQKWSDAQLHLSRFRYFLRLMEQFRENDTAWKILEQASVDLKRA